MHHMQCYASLALGSMDALGGESRVGHMAHQFMHVKQTVELKKITKNAPKLAFLRSKIHKFSGEGLGALILASTTPLPCTPRSLAIPIKNRSRAPVTYTRGHRTPVNQIPHFATCSEVGQTWKCTSIIRMVLSPKTRGPKLPIRVFLRHRDIDEKKGHLDKRKERFVNFQGSSTFSPNLANFGLKRLTLIACMVSVALWSKGGYQIATATFLL